MRKGQFLSPGTKDKRDHATILQPFNQTCFLLWSDSELTKETFACSVPIRYTDITENHSAHIMMFGVVTDTFIHLPIWPLTQRGNLHKAFGGSSAGLDRESSIWKTLRRASGLCTIPHKQRIKVLALRKFPRLHHPWHLAA